MLTGKAMASAADGLHWIEDLCRKLAIPSLRDYGLTQQGIPELVAKSMRASSMQGNPIQLTEDELAEVLHRAM